jgi:hypothetical protein
MSLLSDYIDQYPHETKRLLGLDYESLNHLIAEAEILHRQRQIEINKDKVRIIAEGGGRTVKLSNRDAILLTLTYLRQHLTFQWLGLAFNVSESTAHSLFHDWLEILASLLPASLLEQVQDEASDSAWVQGVLTEDELIVDTTEQQRQRPGEPEEQEKFYSGYKHMHSFKNQLIILPEAKDIVDVVIGEAGPKSDITLFREHQNTFASNQKFKGDKAYAGEANISIPHKKPKNLELTEQQEQENQVFSGQRVFVEHMIRFIKIFRIAQERFRLRARHYQRVIHTVCGLVRFRIGALILSV